MLKKFFKHKHSSKLLAWLLVGVMALSSAGVMPVVAADVSGGDAAVVSDGDVSGGDATETPTSWTFTADGGFTETFEGSNGIATVKGLQIDATNGKFYGRGSDVQVNAGTTVKVPVAGNSTITLVGYSVDYKGNVTFNGEAPTVDGATFTYEYTGAAGYVTIAVTESGYWLSLAVTAKAGSGDNTGSGDETPTSWTFTADGGFSETYEGSNGVATVKGLQIDATNGKFYGRGSDVQVNAGTTVKVPVAGNSTITLVGYSVDYKGDVTFNGEAPTVDGATFTYEYKGAAGYVTIAVTASGYWLSLAVEAKEPTPTSWAFTADGGFSETFEGSNGVATVNGLQIDATNGKFYGRGSDVQVNAGTIVKVPVDGSSTLTLVGYSVDYKGDVTFNGQAPTVDGATFTYNYTGEAGYVTIAVTASGYWLSLAVTEYEGSGEGGEGGGGDEGDEPTTTVRVFDAGDLDDVAKNSKAEGDTLVSGDFTVLCHANTVVEAKATAFDETYTSTKRLSLGGTMKTTTAGVKFATSGAATVKVYWVAGGDGREMKIIDESGTQVAITSVGSTKNSQYISTLEIPEAGTYIIGSSSSSNYVFRIEVTEVPVGETLAEMTLEDLPETWNFRGTSTIFGSAAADIEGDSVFSANKFIKITKDAADAWDVTTNGHGLNFTKDVVIEVLVPANTMGVFTFIGCDYAACNAVMTAGGETGESISLDNGQDAEIPFKYENETNSTVTMKITVSTGSRGYFHGVSYEVQEIPAKSWESGKTGIVTIGDTTFEVKSGAEGAAYTVTATSGTGRVEIAGADKAVVWTDLDGAKLANAVAAGEGVSEVTVSGKVVTITYEDDTTLPESFSLEVRELGKTKEPKQDGTTTTYNLLDGSIISDLYKNSKVPNGTSITSEDGNFTIRSNGNVGYHGTTYGIVLNAGNSFAVKVAGNAKVTIVGSSFGTSAIEATADGDGVIYVQGDEGNNIADTSSTEQLSSNFIYEGEATTLYFNFTGVTYYVTSVIVKNELPPIPEGETHPELGYTLPEVINWDNGLLEATVMGQTISLSNPTGLVKKEIKTSGLGIFVFPLTDDNNTLTVDVVVGACGSSNNNAAYVGLFNESVADDANGIRAITTAVRNTNNEVVQLMSKSDTEVLGKNSFNGAVMEAGDVVRITISRDGSNIIQTFTNLTQGTDTVEKKTAYSATKSFLNPGGEVYYGVMVSNRDTVFKNMVYTAADGTVLFDQNKYYDPVGDIPVVTAVTAVGAEDRTKITINWTADDALFDAKYVLQVMKPGTTEWVDVATELTDKSYEYPVSIGESGEYTFRVCGTRGNAPEQNLANRNTYAVSNEAYIEAALETPVLTLDLVSAPDKVELSWTASAGAASYEVYRRYDDNAAELIATVTEASYTDTAVTTDVPYYYSVKAISDDNFSPLSEEKWTVPTRGFVGDYDESIALHLTKRSYNTVFENKITLEGIVGAAGTVKVYVNGTEKASQAVASANGTFSFEDVEISAGRNEVELVLEYGNNLKLRKSFNYVYLTNYNFVVDDDFTGTDGTADANGIPQYKTVAAAIAAAGASGSTTNVILVRNGDYNEKLVINVPNISLIGEDSEATRIHYAVCDGTKAQEADGSRYAVSILQGATNFTAENICFENSWEYLGDGTYSNESAEAVYVEKTNALFVGVRMLSYQDTLQSKDGNIYVLRSYIAGNVDFMWGVRGKMNYEDCDIVFRYNANKNSGYYTAYGEQTQAVYSNCRFYSEEECGGSKYYLGRPYNGTTAVAFIGCYMGSIINKEWGYASWGGAELSTDPTQYNATEYYEFGTYGPGYAININRRQISNAAAAKLTSVEGMGWDPYRLVTALGNKYIGSVVTEPNDEMVESEYESNSYSPYESDDTGLGKYNMEGFAESAIVTGGGLLKETNDNYYKVATGDEFLAALKAVKDKKGVPSVIEITADIAVGINEIDPNYNSLYGSGVVAPHNPALLNPVLIESGVSKVYIKQMSNLTIFSQNGATIKHGAFTISDSDNIIIRNVSFDELWEWDEGSATAKAGDYDINDWDYMTIENGSNGIWIDHCSFYKAYDGIIDIKTSDAYATPMNVTISWCEFMPGSKDNTFFNQMMDYVKANKANMPYYQSLLDKGMTDEQIWWYAYGQKKTHLLGQDDSATANVNLKVTLANNYYFNTMDRLPRLRYGISHVYNCIMDAQEILDAKKTITNTEIASKLVSNGAISTCNGQVLLENCYMNGIQWALISGNGSSPNGSIAAVDSLYYVDGVRYALVPVTKSTVGEEPKLTDADAFVANLPYSDYNLYDAADLATVVKPYVGAGKLDMDVLQWEKGEYYDATFVAPEEGGNYDDDDLPTYEIPEDVPGTTPDAPGTPTVPGTGSGTAAVVLPTTNNWTEVNAEITTEGAVTVEGIAHVDTTSTGTIEVPVYVIENLKGKNVSLMLHNGKGVAMSITGTMLTGTVAQAVDVTVVSDANTIPADVVAQKTDALATKQLSVKNAGAFAIPVNMHVNVGKEYAGNYATLYKYDQATGELVCAGCFEVTDEGQAMFAMFEGGEYLLVVTAEKPADLTIATLGRYVVKSGDSMYAIARMYKLTLQNLLLKNPQIEDPNMIYVGDKIIVR